MAELLLFHHAQGRTEGCRAFADRLRAAGHAVHDPDLYDGETFDNLADGVAHAEPIGFETIIEHGRLIAEEMTSNELGVDESVTQTTEVTDRPARQGKTTSRR